MSNNLLHNNDLTSGLHSSISLLNVDLNVDVNVDVQDECNILNKCTKLNFYTLIKNEPAYYLNLIEHNDVIKSIASLNNLEIKRDLTNNNMHIEYSLYGTKITTIKCTDTMTDSEMIDIFVTSLVSDFKIYETMDYNIAASKLRKKARV